MKNKWFAQAWQKSVQESRLLLVPGHGEDYSISLRGQAENRKC